MNRLRDESAGDPLAERAIALLRATAGTPPMPDMKRRVWLSLWKADRGVVPHWRRRLVTPTVVLVVGVCAAATAAAGAIIGRRLIAAPDPEVSHGALLPEAAPSGRGKASVSPPPPDRRRVPEPPFSTGRGDSMAAEASMDSVQGELRPSSALRPRVSSDVPARGAPARGAPPRAASPRTASPRAPSAGPLPALSNLKSVGEGSEVFYALIALRRDRNPNRATALLDGYLTAHPRGALHEEALVLAIEAADARRDRGTAVRLAKLYCARYPAGRFRAFAESHVTVAHP